MGTETESKEPTLLERLHAMRTPLVKEWSDALTAREAERAAFEARVASTDNTPTDEERAAFEAAEVAFGATSDQREASITELDKRIAEAEKQQRRIAEAAAAHQGAASVTYEPHTYRRDNAGGQRGVSYYRDLAQVMVEGISFDSTNRTASLARLEQHAREVEKEMPKRAAERARRARTQVAEWEQLDADRQSRGRRSRGYCEVSPLLYDPFVMRDGFDPMAEYRVEPNRADGYGGYFIPPFWLIDEYIPGLRAHLIAAALCRQFDLPPGTDSINIPKLSTLTAVGYQQADNAGVVSQDWTDTFVQANVKTIAGQTDVARQLLEQSPNGIVDEAITTDLTAAFNTFLDQQVLAGDGLNTGTLNGGHLNGLYPSANWSGTNTVTYTDGSPSGQHFQPGAIGPMWSKIARNRYPVSPMDVTYVFHGSRWAWYATSQDVNGRPLVEPDNCGPWNVAARLPETMPAEGLAGMTNLGSPVYIDDNVPTNDNGSGSPVSNGTHDVGFAALWDDLWLFRGQTRTEVFREVLSGSLGVRFQLSEYDAFLERYGQSVAIASGSGFAQPSTGFGDDF